MSNTYLVHVLVFSYMYTTSLCVLFVLIHDKRLQTVCIQAMNVLKQQIQRLLEFLLLKTIPLGLDQSTIIKNKITCIYCEITLLHQEYPVYAPTTYAGI